MKESRQGFPACLRASRGLKQTISSVLENRLMLAVLVIQKGKKVKLILIIFANTCIQNNHFTDIGDK